MNSIFSQTVLTTRTRFSLIYDLRCLNRSQPFTCKSFPIYHPYQISDASTSCSLVIPVKPQAKYRFIEDEEICVVEYMTGAKGGKEVK